MKTEQFRQHADHEERHWWFLGRRRVMRRLIHAVLPPSRDAIVVDVGCGTGGNIAALAREYRCVGIDVSAEAIDIARVRYPDVQFVHGVAPNDLGELAGQANMFLLMDVLEHVRNDFELLSRICSVARPGAYVLIFVPANLALWSKHDESLGHFRRYDRRRLERLWTNTPMESLLLAPFNTRLYPVVRFIRAINRRLGRSLGTSGTDLRMPPKPVNDVLARMLAGEGPRLEAHLKRKDVSVPGSGVSLIALLRREPGQMSIQRRPPDVAPDRYDPEAASARG